MKRYYPGITDKRLNNRRFYRTEEAILKAFFGNTYLSVREVTRQVGIARSTFYHHHQSTAKILADYQRYIKYKYKRKTKKMLVSQKVPERSILKNMIAKMQPRLVDIMHLPKNSKKIFLVYEGEVTSLIDAWCRNGMREDEINRLLDEIIFLTETARVRLKILL